MWDDPLTVPTLPIGSRENHHDISINLKENLRLCFFFLFLLQHKTQKWRELRCWFSHGDSTWSQRGAQNYLLVLRHIYGKLVQEVSNNTVLFLWSQRSKLTFSKSHLLATFNCKMVAIKKIQSPKRNLKGRTLHDILHERLMRRTARFRYFALLQ